MNAIRHFSFLAAVLCIVPVKSEFLEEPVDKAYSIDSPATISCRANMTEKATCSWFYNSTLLNIDKSKYSLPKDGEKGDCQLKIAKFAIKHAGAWKCKINQNESREVLIEAQAVPETFKFKINDSDVGAIMAVYLVPLDSIIVIEVTALNAYPKFLQEGSFFAYQNGALLESEIKLEDSTKIKEANSLTATVQVQVDKTASIKFVAKNRSYPGGQKESYIVLRSDSEEMPLTYRSYAGLVGTKVSVDAARESDVGLYRRTYKWFQLNEATNVWRPAGSPKTGLKLNALAVGSYTYKMSYEQDKPFKLTAESHPVHILIYEPLHDVAMELPHNLNNITIKAGYIHEFRCTAKGNPEPEFYWVLATSDGLETVSEMKTLVLGSSGTLSGKYKCAATQTLFGQIVVQEAKEVLIVKIV